MKTKIIVKNNKDIIEKELKKVKSLNRIFKKATPAEKRIIIAKDVIAQIELGKYIPETGSYCKSRNIKRGVDLQSIIIEPKFKCSVCELGGLFTSLIRIKDNFTSTLAGEVDNSLIFEELINYFSGKQISLIESAFEESGYGVLYSKEDNEISLERKKASKNYRAKYKISNNRYNLLKYMNITSDEYYSDESGKYNKEMLKLRSINNKEAMIKICRNIIDNKGSFRPKR